MTRLTIRRIECVPLRMPLPRTYRGSSYFMTHRCTIITRVFTAEGVVGEVYNGDEFETQAEVVKIILDEIQPLLIGEDAFNIEGCWEGCASRATISCGTASSRCAPRRASTAPCGTPSERRSTRRSTSSGEDTPNVFRSSASPDTTRRTRPSPTSAGKWRRFWASGYAGCKFKVGGRTPGEDAERVRVARKAAGEDFVLTVDANQGWSLREAVAFSREVAELDIRWFEEPVHWPNDRLDMAAVRSQTGIPVCAGQSEISRSGCRDLMMANAIDVCNFDASWGAGRPNGAGSRRSRPAFPCRWGTTRSRRSRPIFWRRSPTARIWKRFIPSGTRSSTLWSRTGPSSTAAFTPCRRARASASSSIRTRSRNIASRPILAARRATRPRRAAARAARPRLRAPRRDDNRRSQAPGTAGRRRPHEHGRRVRRLPGFRCRTRPRPAARRVAAQQMIDFILRMDVDSSRRLLEQQQDRRAVERLGDRHLLLVAAR